MKTRTEYHVVIRPQGHVIWVRELRDFATSKLIAESRVELPTGASNPYTKLPPRRGTRNA